MYAVVGLDHVSASSQSVCRSVGHQEHKLHVNFMVDEEFFVYVCFSPHIALDPSAPLQQSP